MMTFMNLQNVNEYGYHGNVRKGYIQKDKVKEYHQKSI